MGALYPIYTQSTKGNSNQQTKYRSKLVQWHSLAENYPLPSFCILSLENCLSPDTQVTYYKKKFAYHLPKRVQAQFIETVQDYQFYLR